MDANLYQYLNYETNVVKAEVIISREKTSRGQEYIHISIDEDEMYTFWHNPDKVKSKSERRTGGGKKSYIMLMIEHIGEVQLQIDEDISPILGDAVRLANNIEWGTGKLINKRTKKPLKYDDVRKIYSCSCEKLNNKISKMKGINLLRHTSEGYFISTDFIKKGGSRCEDNKV